MSSGQSTFHLPSPYPRVSVQLPPSLTSDELLGFGPFTTWLSTLQESLALQQSNPSHPFFASPYALRSINIQSVDHFRGGSDRKIGFLKLQAEISNDDGQELPGSIFLRGGSVSMLVVLRPSDVNPERSEYEDEACVILTVQPRIPAASLSFVELPAGMIDQEGNFKGTAAKEIEEELSVKIEEHELIDLTKLALEEHPAPAGESGKTLKEKLQLAMYPSPGGSDEYMPIFYCSKHVARDQLQSWEGKMTGLREHGEMISLRVVKLRNLWWAGARDSKCLSAYALYQELRAAGKIQ